MGSKQKNIPVTQIINFHDVKQVPNSSINFSPKAPENRYKDDEIAVSLSGDSVEHGEVIELHKKRVIDYPQTP